MQSLMTVGFEMKKS